MRTKAITSDCAACDIMHVDDKSQMVCHWGNKKNVKILLPQKGKKPLFCKLKR